MKATILQEWKVVVGAYQEWATDLGKTAEWFEPTEPEFRNCFIESGIPLSS